jgi:hypothetical protein
MVGSQGRIDKEIPIMGNSWESGLCIGEVTKCDARGHG